MEAIDGRPWPSATAESDASATARRATWLRRTTKAMLVLSVVTLWTFSVPGTYFLVLMLLPWAWLAVAAVWLLSAAGWMGHVGFRRAIRSGWLATGVLVGVGTILAVVFALPLHARFELSRPSLDALTVEMSQPDAPEMTEQRAVGLFDAEWVEPFDGGYRFLVRGTGFLDPTGFAYSPSGPPPNIGGEDRYYWFSGPWWIWVESW
jgi:hypothetical protein